MADKEILIAQKTLLYGTSVKVSPETNVSQTKTFDGPITQGTDKIGWSIDLEKVRFDDSVSYKDLHQTLDKMLTKSEMVTVRETIHTENESFTIVDNFFGCILDGNEYTIKPDDHTAEAIKFKASSRERKYE